MANPLKVGDTAPGFTATTHDGKTISLADYRGQSAVILFFYPKDGTAVCTKEACAFRDSYEHFLELGAVVLGVSSDSNASHDQFAKQYRLPFPLISDRDGTLRKLFAVPRTLGIFPGRVTYVIDKHGIIQLVFNAQLVSEGHVQNAMRALRQQVR